MSNHFNFVLYGSLKECRAFANEYKRRCAIRMRLSSGKVCGKKEVKVSADLIDTIEYLENVIAYILRNPLVARIPIMPYHYELSSTGIYFDGDKVPQGTHLNDMSERKRHDVLHSRAKVPDEYFITEEGMIYPSCYVDYSTVERIYKTPANLFNRLARKVENEIELKMGICETITMTDNELKTEMTELIPNEFHCSSIAQLSMDDRILLCRLIRNNFQSGAKQIARLTRLAVSVVKKYLARKHSENARNTLKFRGITSVFSIKLHCVSITGSAPSLQNGRSSSPVGAA